MITTTTTEPPACDPLGIVLDWRPPEGITVRSIDWEEDGLLVLLQSTPRRRASVRLAPGLTPSAIRARLASETTAILA